MTQFTIPASPPVPQSQQPATEFNSKTDAWLRYIAQDLVPQLNEFILQLNNFATTATTTQTLTIGTGAGLVFTVESGKGFLPGMSVKLVSLVDPTKWMVGEIEAYNTSTGVISLTIIGKQGSGSFTGWRLFMAAVEQLDSGYISRLPIKSSVEASDYLAISGADNITSKILASFLRMSVSSIFIWPTNILPDNAIWVPTAATSLSRTTYSRLHDKMSAASYPWGSGDGSTTFGIPWMPPNYAPVQTNGSNVATQTVGEVIAHSHTMNAGGNATASLNSGGSVNLASSTTGSTGGSANLAAGVRFRFAMFYQ